MTALTVPVSGRCMSDHPPCTGYPHVGPVQWDQGAVRDVRDQKALLGLQHRILMLEHNIEMERRTREAAEGKALLRQMELERELARAAMRVVPSARTPDDLRYIDQWMGPHGIHDADVERLRERVNDALDQAERFAAMGRLNTNQPIDWEALAAQWADEAGFVDPPTVDVSPVRVATAERVWFAMSGGPRGGTRIGVYHAFDIPDVEAQRRAEARGPSKDMVAICGRKVAWFYMHHSTVERPRRYTCRRCFEETIKAGRAK